MSPILTENNPFIMNDFISHPDRDHYVSLYSLFILHSWLGLTQLLVEQPAANSHFRNHKLYALLYNYRVHSAHCTPEFRLRTEMIRNFKPKYFGFQFTEWKLERNWVFATNSDCLIPISLHPNVVNFRYFKLWILLDQII